MGLPGGKNGQIHFGPFELDPDAEQLRRRGVALRLQPKQFVLLLLLAQRAGEVVSRQEIQQRVWGDDTFVDFDRGINFCINQVRAALGDDADRPRFIETIPRRGYRFIAKIESNGRVEAGSPGSLTPGAPPSRDHDYDKQQVPSTATFRRGENSWRAVWYCLQRSGLRSLSPAPGGGFAPNGQQRLQLP